MTTIQQQCATQVCEDFLRAEIAYNYEHNLLRSESEIANRLLERGAEMKDCYEESFERLRADQSQVRILMGAILSVGAFWNPKALAKDRIDRDRLIELNEEISCLASDLAARLEERDKIQNSSSFHGDTHYHVLEVIEDSAQSHGLFNSWVKDKLKSLRGQFDLKYWPPISDFMWALASDAAVAIIDTSDRITAAGTQSSRNSKADFVRALYAGLEEYRDDDCPHSLPAEFSLTDAAMASITNCVLGLGPDELVDGLYIKGIRQRDRTRKKP